MRALPAYLAFGLTYWMTAPTVGLAGGLAAATATCCLTYNAAAHPRRQASGGDTATRTRSPTGLAR